MSVISVDRDVAGLTMSVVAEFDAPVGRVWKLWDDPRQLEKWWGPPTYPATVVDHDVTPGGRVNYYMTGPDGDQPRGWWRVIAVDPPHRLEFEDGFSDAAGKPNPEMPTMIIRVALDERPGGGTRVTIATKFSSVEAMEQLMAMGMEEGMAAAMGQMDALVAAV